MNNELLTLRRCPKCDGDGLHIDRDVHGWYVTCLYCGYLKDIEPPNNPQPKLTIVGRVKIK